MLRRQQDVHCDPFGSRKALLARPIHNGGDAFTTMHSLHASILLQGVPEDLLFFYRSIRRGGGVFRVDQCLLVYRYHEKATTHSVSESVPLVDLFFCC